MNPISWFANLISCLVSFVTAAFRLKKSLLHEV
jgi:hypothetical protein